MKTKLDEVSPSFCLNMWHFGHINFEQSSSTFCCHLPRKEIPLEELEKDPTALLHSKESLERKKEMLLGAKHSDCGNCWRAEQETGMSNRIVNSHYLRNQLANTQQNPWGQKAPAILELFFSSVCNFKCIYCDSTFSSKWKSEIEEFGSYKIDEKFSLHQNFSVDRSKSNQSIAAFWKWWPQLRENVKQLKLSGGEPLLHQETFQIIHHLSSTFSPNLKFSLNTNLGVPEPIIEKFCAALSTLENKVSSVSIFVSMESVGKRAEYIRFGLNWNLFEKNLEKLLSADTAQEIVFNSSLTCLSLPFYSEFLNFVSDIRKRYPHKEIKVDPNLVFDPKFLQIENTPTFLRSKWDECERIFESFGDKGNIRLVNMRNIGKRLKNIPPFSTEIQRTHLRVYLNELDRRRKISHQMAFPEYASYFSNAENERRAEEAIF
jgi:organic radical activating enzyme